MRRDNRVPSWLARRTYFKRIERWTKLDKNRKPAAASAVEAIPLPSNVVPFPMRLSRTERPDFSDLRGVGTA